ncbi:hypothetical protein EB796_022593 [Bugula neritina]|uniref:Uncharacterized protein n=1 Tax=Bugula neritina TaxID=10212 RepID=A0A7J7IZZ2_BUGNE|nr:hypothetical protein EB796_022593 [Bugula neritina]
MVAEEQFSVVEFDNGDGWTRIRKDTGDEGFVPTTYIQIKYVLGMSVCLSVSTNGLLNNYTHVYGYGFRWPYCKSESANKEF